MGEVTNLKQNISVSDKTLLGVSCKYGERVYSIGLKVMSRNGVKQQIDIGYPPEDSDGQVLTDSRSLPRYQFIRSITFFGELEDKPESPDDAPDEDEDHQKSAGQLGKGPINNGEPLLEKNGATFIYPENVGRRQYIKLTGFMLDVVA